MRARIVWLTSLIFLLPLLLLPFARSAQEEGWRSLGLRGQTVLALVAASGSEGLIYAETPSGLWRYAAGQTSEWVAIHHALPRNALGGPALASWRVVPGRPRQLYAITGAGTARQLYRSDDAGATWRNIGPAPGQSARPPLVALAGLSGAADTLALVTDTRIQRSTDGGVTWAPGGPWPGGAATAPQTLLADSSNTERLFALTASNLLWLSESGGRAWRTIEPIVNGRPVGPLTAIAITPYFGVRIWVAGTGGLAYSADSGATWTLQPLPTAEAVALLLAEPRAPDTLYLTTMRGAVYRSDDAGSTWRALGVIPAGRPLALSLDPDTRGQLYAGTTDGVWARSVIPAQPPALPMDETRPAELLTTVESPPVGEPTSQPTDTPAPTATLTRTPTPGPTATDRPTSTPTRRPTDTPTRRPTETPTRRPTDTPTRPPTETPTRWPTDTPTVSPPPFTPGEATAIPPSASPTTAVPTALPVTPTPFPTPAPR